ncbi:MAG: hypothetical protein D6721_06145 [Gammaproteobacteria bacterium]|nr:MAG: hypothetical protein D6721_06145 [Gammaproteobacteria bacterium]
MQFAGLLLLEVRTAPRARRRRWLLVRDMMDREHFRRLCVRARMDAEPRPVREGRPDDTSHAS